MKIAFQTLVKTLIFCFYAWNANVLAGNLQYKIEEFYDESASLHLDQVSNLNFSPTSGKIRKPYQTGTLWLRVSIAANRSNSFLFFENPSIDEVFIYSRDQINLGPWSSEQIPMRSLLQGYLLDKQTGNLNDSLVIKRLHTIKRVKIAAINSRDFLEPYQSEIATNSYPLARMVYCIQRDGKVGLGTGLQRFLYDETGQLIALKFGLMPFRQPERSLHFNEQ